MKKIYPFLGLALTVSTLVGCSTIDIPYSYNGNNIDLSNYHIKDFDDYTAIGYGSKTSTTNKKNVKRAQTTTSSGLGNSIDLRNFSEDDTRVLTSDQPFNLVGLTDNDILQSLVAENDDSEVQNEISVTECYNLNDFIAFSVSSTGEQDEYFLTTERNPLGEPAWNNFTSLGDYEWGLSASYYYLLSKETGNIYSLGEAFEDAYNTYFSIYDNENGLYLYLRGGSATTGVYLFGEQDGLLTYRLIVPGSLFAGLEVAVEEGFNVDRYGNVAVYGGFVDASGTFHKVSDIFGDAEIHYSPEWQIFFGISGDAESPETYVLNEDCTAEMIPNNVRFPLGIYLYSENDISYFYLEEKSYQSCTFWSDYYAQLEYAYPRFGEKWLEYNTLYAITFNSTFSYEVVEVVQEKEYQIYSNGGLYVAKEDSIYKYSIKDREEIELNVDGYIISDFSVDDNGYLKVKGFTTQMENFEGYLTEDDQIVFSVTGQYNDFQTYYLSPLN